MSYSRETVLRDAAEIELKKIERKRPTRLSESMWSKIPEIFARGRAFAAGLGNNPPEEKLGLVDDDPDATQQNYVEFVEAVEEWLNKGTQIDSPRELRILLIVFLLGIHDFFHSSPGRKGQSLYILHLFYSGILQQLLTDAFVTTGWRDRNRLRQIVEDLSLEKDQARAVFSGAKTEAFLIEILINCGVEVFVLPIYFDLLHAGDLLVVLPDEQGALYLQVKTIRSQETSVHVLSSRPIDGSEELRVYLGAKVFEQETLIKTTPALVRVERQGKTRDILTRIIPQLRGTT